MLDFSLLGGSNTVDNSTLPREIFQALPKTVAKFQYPRDVQSQVWNKWHETRDTQNLVIKMNTGGGKTLVGLLILKSCLNESKGPAVYVVPDNYLVKQVIEEARSIGIEATTDHNDVRFLAGNSILVINIFKLVNGKSVFGVDDQGIKTPIGSIIIDDAHACLETVEEQFTMKIPSSSDMYKELMRTFASSLETQARAKYNEIINNDPSAFLQVPFWSWQKHQDIVTDVLVRNKSDSSIEFNYPLIKNHLRLANCVFSAKSVEISPHFIPISVLPALVHAKRKIFMTATLADDSILTTHFGVQPQFLQNPITPDSAGDVGDRMILLPQVINPTFTDNDIKQICVNISQKHNVVVIVPSKHRANFWSDVSKLKLTTENINEGVQRLKREHVGLVVLVNRYDGIDLPQQACRLLVIDGLPDSTSLIDRVKQAALLSNSFTNIEKIQQIEQGMGRGIRSNDDYCVVMLSGKRLTCTVYADNAREHFSPATKSQMQLSELIAQQTKDASIEKVEELMNFCLNRDENWVKMSKSRLASLKYDDAKQETNIKVMLHEAYILACNGNYQLACTKIEQLSNQCSDNNSLKGYIKQILAEYTNLHDETEAQKILLAASTLNQRLMKPIAGITYSKVNSLTHGQAEQCSTYMHRFKSGNQMLITANGILEDLQFVPNSANRFEAAINDLGKLLGFKAQRPEAVFNKGPDNLWSIGDNAYLVIECKNEAITQTISKGYCNQLNGSHEWFRTNYDFSATCTPIMVHPSTTFEYASSPNETIRIINEAKLSELKSSAKSFFESIAANNELNNINAIREKLTTYRLRSQDIVPNYTMPYSCK